MAKLVLFLQTDASAKEKLTSTSLAEPKHLQHPPPFIIFAAKITIKNNRNMERLFFFVIAAALAFGVGCLGRNRKIGFGWAFGISLINVVIGLIVVLCSKKKTPNELEKKN